MRTLLFAFFIISCSFAARTKTSLRHDQRLVSHHSALSKSSYLRFPRFQEVSDNSEVEKLKEQLKKDREVIHKLKSAISSKNKVNKAQSLANYDIFENKAIGKYHSDLDSYKPVIKMTKVEVPDNYKPQIMKQPVQPQIQELPTPENNFYTTELPVPFKDHSQEVAPINPIITPQPQIPAQTESNQNDGTMSFQEVEPPAQYKKPVLERYNEMAGLELNNFIDKQIDGGLGDINVSANVIGPSTTSGPNFGADIY